MSLSMTKTNKAINNPGLKIKIKHPRNYIET